MTWLPADFCLLARTHRLHVADQGEANTGEFAEKVLYYLSPLTLDNAQTRTHPKPILQLGFVAFVHVDMEFECLHEFKQCP